MKPEIIYFDMDDTIADFSLGLKEICDIEPVNQSDSTKEQDDLMWQAIKEVGDFYYRLKELNCGIEVLRKLKEDGCNVAILSATPKEKRGIISAESDKRRWVVEHIDEDIDVIIVHTASQKKNYAKPNCILVDDLKKNIDEWKENGGNGILFDRNNPQKVYEEIMSCINNAL